MLNNIQIGKYIKHALSTLSVQVFPIGQDGSNQGDSYAPPFVTYKRNAFSEESTKDGAYEGAVTVSIDVVATTYEQLITLVGNVYDAMHTGMGTWNAQDEKPFRVLDQTANIGAEDMDDTMTLYVCELTYEIETF